MSSYVSALSIRSGQERQFHLWIWHSVVVFLLLPVALLLLPLILAACLFRRVNFFGALSALCGFLVALQGSHVEVMVNRCTVTIDIA